MPKKPRAIATRHEDGGRHHALKKRRTGLIVSLSIIGFVLIGVVAVGAWVGTRALEAKDSLESAQSLVGDIQTKATAQDLAGAAADASKLQEQTARAVELTSDPVWRASEHVPVLGSNLTAVRELASAVNTVAVDAVDPIMAIAAGGLDAFKPVDGRIDVALVQQVSTAVNSADDVLKDASAKVDAVDTSQTIGVVTEATEKLSGLLDKATTLTGEARTPLSLLAPMLGADGPRNYILLFQNNAEAMSLGGNTAAWVILNVDNGAISITAQPSSADFPRNLPIPITMDPATLAAFNPDYFRYATNVTLRPDFPTAGVLAQAFWERESGQVVDGVLAFDPIALSYLLGATGPLVLPTGQTLTEENTVKLLLSDVYAMFEEPSDQDAFFAAAAASIFGALTTATPDIGKLIPALTKAIDDDRLMAWSAHPEEQAIIATTAVAGIMPTDNVEKTQIGVFFSEASASKMSYYMRTATTVTDNSCVTPDAPTFSASVSLKSDLTLADYVKLPAYVKSGYYLKAPFKTRTLMWVYGPPGGSFTDFTWDGGGMETTLVTTGTDLGRPVAQFSVYLKPGETSVITANFAAPAGDYGPLDVRVTPMVNPTEVTMSSPGCEPAQ